MNKQQLLLLAQRQIDENRFKAEEKRDSLLKKLRTDLRYKDCERQLRIAQFSNKDKASLDKCKTAMNALLKEMGVDKQQLQPQYSCKICNDTGYVNNKPCICLKNEYNKLLSSQSKVPDHSFTFENSSEINKHNIAVYKKAKEIVETGDKNILLTGNTGSGKTYLITACANLAIKLNRSALFYTAYDLNSTFLEAHLSDYQTKQTILDLLTDVDVLTIDDLGTEINYKNVTAEYLFVIINERISNKKQTFVSTNLSLTDIRERYDERIFSRLVDQSCTVVAQLQGADKRIKK